MTKFRAFKNYALVYSLEEREAGFLLSIEKSGEVVSERSAYIVCGDESDLNALLCRLWRCAVTPMSLAYVLEDEGYIAAESELSPTLHCPQDRASRCITSNAPNKGRRPKSSAFFSWALCMCKNLAVKVHCALGSGRS